MYISTAASWITLLVRQFQLLNSFKNYLLGEDLSGWFQITVQEYVGSGALMLNVC